ncbi:hypothetical protein DFH09DRAFT_1425797 [Mycena vulgaris]|nr:hypothetical protein DFH09DRAFT_1425797 [Mycena vulgaris]
MEDTRVDILNIIDEWIDDVDSPNLFWLRGHPGTGKSTIATTVRDRLQHAGRLGSSFFFRREDFTLQTPEALWCSVAYDLAQQYPSIRRVVVDQLKLHNIDPDGSDHDLILNQLIVVLLGVPLHIDPKKLPVVVIDALDECGGGREQARSYQKKLLLALTKWQLLLTRVKIFVTSRDEGDIGLVLGKEGLSSRILDVGLNVSEATSRDIEKYFKHNFDEICQSLEIKDPWPTESQLQLLTHTAAGLFIWASTVIKLVEGGPPKMELDQILKMITIGESSTDHLAQLYEDILTSKFSKPTLISLFIEVAGTVIVARTPLSLEDLLKLLPALDPDNVKWVCSQLKSVLKIQGGLRFLHQSFVDFLVAISANFKFHCSRQHHEQRLASACFSTMERTLHFNMGNIQTSYLRNDDIPDLLHSIPVHLKYSSQFWGAHLKNCVPEALMGSKVGEFMKFQLLYWLEVMSIGQMVGKAAESLELLIAWSADNCDSELRKRANDALSFVRSFGTPISMAVPHIYLSALVLAPENSITRETYLQQVPGVVKLNTGGDLTWPSLQGVLRGHNDWVMSIAFSPDGRQIVSGSTDRTVRIWDAESQQQIGEPFIGHNGYVLSVAFSANGRQIVSGSEDKTVWIWDAESQQQIGRPLTGHDGLVRSVAFSPDSRQIVSGSNDKTVCIWDAKSQQQIGQPLIGHDGWVLSVAFLPESRHIVSGSADSTVRIWDAESQQQIGEPLIGHNGYVLSVAFSSDGRQIVSGSSDKTARIWDAESQQQIGEPLIGHGDSGTSVAFSPDGRQVISSSKDYTLNMWDMSQHYTMDHTPSNLPITILQPETNCLSPALTLQPDGWLVGPNAELLLWIPNQLISRLPRKFLLGICGGPPLIIFETKTFHHGEQWTRCKTG